MTFGNDKIAARAAGVGIGIAAAAVLLSGCSLLFPPRGGVTHTLPPPSAPVTTAPVSSPTRIPATPAPAAATPASSMAAGRQAKTTASLYKRLGGYDAIAALTDDFLGRATNDPVIVPFFRGLTTADLQRIRQHVVDMLCAASGGPCFYPGRDMKSVHKDMEITNDVWNAFTGHLNETVARFKIADRERNELVVIVGSLRGDIVNK
jgi:hemoglobin